VAATKKALQRLVKRGLVVVPNQQEVPEGSPLYLYQAVLSIPSTTRGRGETEIVSPGGQIPSAGTDEGGDTPSGAEEGVPTPPESAGGWGHSSTEDTPCLHPDPSAGAENGRWGHSGEYPRARAELDKLDAEATSFWKE